MHHTRWFMFVGGTILLGACGNSAPDRGPEDAAAGHRDATAAPAGGSDTAGTTRLGADAAPARGGVAGSSGPGAGGRGGAGSGGGPGVTGAGGAVVFGGASGQGTLACWGEGGPCNTATDFCCSGFSCASTSTEPGYHCKQNCAASGECPSGCCAPLANTGTSICLDRIYCPALFCHQEEEACLDTLTCCDGLACALFDTSTAQTSACKPLCARNADCPTGCCAPLGNTGTSVCLDPIYCPGVSCHDAEETCAKDLACCDGLLCVIFPTNPETSACKPTCANNKDCASGCCVFLGTGYPGACLEKSYCTTAS